MNLTGKFHLKTILSIALFVIVGLIVFSPSFKLALFGDDWLALFRYRYHLGDWSNGDFTHLTYFLNPYGAQDINFGLLHKIFAFDSRYYYITNFIYRALTASVLFLMFYKFTKNNIVALISAIYFMITPIGADVTNWVFNMTSFLSLSSFGVFLLFFLKSQQRKSFKYAFIASLFYYIAFVLAPIRMHGLPIFAVLMEIYYLFNYGFKKNIKDAIFRQILFIAAFLAVKTFGNSLGLYTDPLEKLTIGFNYMKSQVANNNFVFILHPFVIVGRFFTHENLWLFLNKYNDVPIMRHVVIYSLINFLPIFIYVKNIVNKYNKSKFYLYIFVLILWIIFVKVIKNTGNNIFAPYDIYGPAITAGLLIISSIYLILVRKNQSSIFLIASIVWIFLSFFFPFLWSPDALLGTNHRYLIIPAFGVAMFWASLYSFANDTKQKIFISAIILFNFLPTAIISNSYFSNLVKVRGEHLNEDVWKSLPKNDVVGVKTPIIYYFEGDSGIVYHLITFGFPPHMALEYNIKDTGKIPTAFQSKDELIKNYLTGENMHAYGYENKPLPLENIFAYRLNEKKKLIDITDEIRNELLDLKTTNK